jgi:Cu/Ag efflux pump CusA
MDILTRFGLQKSRLTFLAMIGLLIMGALTFDQLPELENPAITIRTAIVSASFSGMSPERVEDLLATPIELMAPTLIPAMEMQRLQLLRSPVKGLICEKYGMSQAICAKNSTNSMASPRSV